MSSSTFLTVSWLSIFASTKPSSSILSIDRSKPRIEKHNNGGKTRKIKKKTMEISTFFVNFQQNKTQNYFIQIKKIKTGYLAFN